MIEWTGTKNALSWAYLVGVDALDVVGTLKPSTERYEQDDSRLSYVGPWVGTSASGLSGGTQKTLYAPGSVTVKFEGSYLAWIGRKAPYYGVARVTLDGKTSTTVDLYSPTDTYKARVYSTGLLARGSHTLTIEWTGAKNAAATYHLIGVDAFDVVGTLTQAPAASAQSAPVVPDARSFSTLSTLETSGGPVDSAGSPLEDTDSSVYEDLRTDMTTTTTDPGVD